MIWILFIGIALLSYAVQANLQHKFKRFSREPLASGLTGREVAEKMLHDNGIYNVTVISTPGQLTDHYNPTNQTVNLSEGVFNSTSVAAAAVAAHECGPCRSTRHGLRAFAPAFRPGACRLDGLAGGVVDFAGWHLARADVSSPSAFRHRLVCHDHALQRHHPSGGNRRLAPRHRVAATRRHHFQP